MTRLAGQAASTRAPSCLARATTELPKRPESPRPKLALVRESIVGIHGCTFPTEPRSLVVLCSTSEKRLVMNRTGGADLLCDSCLHIQLRCGIVGNQHSTG